MPRARAPPVADTGFDPFADRSLESFGLYLRKPCPSVPARLASSTNEAVGAKGVPRPPHTHR